MKTLTTSSDNISRYIFEDDDTVTLETDRIICEHFHVGDMNVSNATLHLGVTPPEDWYGCKYLFDGADWTVNPDFITISG